MTTQRNKVSKRKSSANFTHENLKMMRFNEEMSYNFEEVFDRIRIEGDGIAFSEQFDIVSKEQKKIMNF